MRRDGAANRERILLAAEHVFGAAGAGASTEEVARLAGVGVATVFRHFPTKQELVEATAVRYLERLELQARELTEHDDPGSALAAALRILVASGPTKVTLLNLLFSEGEGLTDPVLTIVDTIRGHVGLLLERAQAAGCARPDVTADLVLTLARALAHVAGPDAAATAARATEIVLDGLGVPSPAVLGPTAG